MRISPLRRTERDFEILRSLVHHVRIFSLQQIARTWWSGSVDGERDAKRRLALLEQEGFIAFYRALAHPEIKLTGPVGVWAPGDYTPELGAISYRLQSRWTLPPVPTTFVMATTLAARSLGGYPGRPSRESEQTHDLHMAGVFLRVRLTEPGVIAYWKSESRIVRERGGSNEKVPDAVLDLPTGPKIVEFGGAYSKEKLERFHAYWELYEVPYEIW